MERHIAKERQDPAASEQRAVLASFKSRFEAERIKREQYFEAYIQEVRKKILEVRSSEPSECLRKGAARA